MKLFNAAVTQIDIGKGLKWRLWLQSKNSNWDFISGTRRYAIISGVLPGLEGNRFREEVTLSRLVLIDQMDSHDLHRATGSRRPQFTDLQRG